MLDMSITVYKKQSQSSRDKLGEALSNNFEFLEYSITPASFDKMIKTWIRKDRERMKRNFAGSTKAPLKYNDTQWDALKRHWTTLSPKRSQSECLRIERNS